MKSSRTFLHRDCLSQSDLNTPFPFQTSPKTARQTYPVRHNDSSFTDQILEAVEALHFFVVSPRLPHGSLAASGWILGSRTSQSTSSPNRYPFSSALPVQEFDEASQHSTQIARCRSNGPELLETAGLGASGLDDLGYLSLSLASLTSTGWCQWPKTDRAGPWIILSTQQRRPDRQSIL